GLATCASQLPCVLEANGCLAIGRFRRPLAARPALLCRYCQRRQSPKCVRSAIVIAFLADFVKKRDGQYNISLKDFEIAVLVVGASVWGCWSCWRPSDGPS